MVKISYIVKQNAILQIERFNGKNCAYALSSCYRAGYTPMSMIHFIDERLALPKNHPLWQFKKYSTASIRAAGLTKAGKKAIVYAHIPNYATNSENFRHQIKKEKFTQDGALIIPKKEFYNLLGMEDNKTVFVMDEKKIKKSWNPHGACGADSSALQGSLEFKCFMGGEERKTSYLDRQKQFFGDLSVSIDSHGDEASSEPVARFLIVHEFYRQFVADELLQGFCLQENMKFVRTPFIGYKYLGQPLNKNLEKMLVS